MAKLEKYKIKEKAWKQANKERELNKSRKWLAENLEHRRAYKRALYIKQMQNPIFRLKKNLRSRFYSALKFNEKNNSILKYLGCSVEELRAYIESKWDSNMNWSNYGFKGWHIDHIRPLDAFDHSKEDELYKAWNYTNLQPLWWQDNLKKGRKGNV